MKGCKRTVQALSRMSQLRKSSSAARVVDGVVAEECDLKKGFALRRHLARRAG
jgi:hypothetical protein